MASAIIAVSILAVDSSKVDKSIELKNGSTVYVFKEAKMAMEHKLGKVAPMKAHVMKTKNGAKVIMIGNELSRLEPILHRDRKN